MAQKKVPQEARKKGTAYKKANAYPAKKLKTESISELARGDLPRRVLDALGEDEISLVELTDWERSKRPLRLELKDEKLWFELRCQIPMSKRAFAAVCVLIFLMVLLANMAFQHPEVLKTILKLALE